jgi:hypothetical protein
VGDKMATQAHDIEKYFLAVLVVFGLGCLNLGCSQTIFSSNEQSSEAVNTISDGSPFGSAGKVTVTTLSKSQIYDPILGLYIVTSVNLKADGITCEVSTETWSEVCADPELSDLCMNVKTESVGKSVDYACAQVFKAKDILIARNGLSCIAKSEALTGFEVSQINDPNIYKIAAEVPINGGVQLPQVDIPSLTGIALDASCLCTYDSSGGALGASYKLPALNGHCRAHFPDVY